MVEPTYRTLEIVALATLIAVPIGIAVALYLTEYGKMSAMTPIAKQLRRLQRENMRHLASLIEAAVRRREIRRVPSAALAAKLFDIARGLVERQLLDWKEFQVRNEVAFATDLLWNGIAHQGPARREK